MYTIQETLIQASVSPQTQDTNSQRDYSSREPALQGCNCDMWFIGSVMVLVIQKSEKYSFPFFSSHRFAHGVSELLIDFICFQ